MKCMETTDVSIGVRQQPPCVQFVAQSAIVANGAKCAAMFGSKKPLPGEKFATVAYGPL